MLLALTIIVSYPHVSKSINQIISPKTTISTLGAPITNDFCISGPAFSSTIDLDNEMIAIEAKEFVMGNNKQPISSPEHQIQVASFLIDKYEVSNIQYYQFVNKTGHEAPPDWPGGQFASGKAYFPVSNVSWTDAITYCEWAGKRLPTEMEWEAACRGPRNNDFPWGDEIITGTVNSKEALCNAPSPLGSFVLYNDISDMIGNVGEWTSSISWPYPYEDTDGREERSIPDEYRSIRGGTYDLDLMTCYDRMDALPEYRLPDVGFRCAKDKD